MSGGGVDQPGNTGSLSWLSQIDVNKVGEKIAEAEARGKRCAVILKHVNYIYQKWYTSKIFY
jgi:hypothetical protein